MLQYVTCVLYTSARRKGGEDITKVCVCLLFLYKYNINVIFHVFLNIHNHVHFLIFRRLMFTYTGYIQSKGEN